MKTLGLRHIALNVFDVKACADFYTHIFNMTIEWQPDPDNIYLTSGNDNLALHRAPTDFAPHKHQHLDHIGFFLNQPADADEWYAYLLHHKVEMKAPPKDHRDGTRSFYCLDPDGNVVQMIYYPQTFTP